MPHPQTCDTYRPSYAKKPTVKRAEDGLPILWADCDDDMMHRAQRAYRLVCKYEHESMGGKRWTHDDIEEIREAGKDLSNNISNIYKWRVRVARNGFNDYEDIIGEDIEITIELCKDIRDLINKREHVPVKVGDAIDVCGADDFKIKGAAASSKG